ncbi:MAG: chromosomal replication initiator DnaA [Rhizobiaceae bacterium]|nr:chromosomal replication initiator DnaA [Rhizobiaceae bacterium]
MVGRDERVIEACDCVIDLAAAFFNLPSRELRRAGRSSGEISRVRQIGMYVSHVVLGLSMTEVGKGFGRDRTTVMHACHLVEDLRDDEDFDHIIARTEHIVAAAFRGRLPL